MESSHHGVGFGRDLVGSENRSGRHGRRPITTPVSRRGCLPPDEHHAPAAIRRALADGASHVDASVFTLDWEATHAVADHDCDDERITLSCQHNIGADPADQLEPGDPLLGGGVVRPELEGILSSSTDLNQVRKHVIDLRSRSITTTAYPDPRAAAPNRLSFCGFPVVGPHAELLRDQAALRAS